MVGLLMPPKNAESKEASRKAIRKTASVQIDGDLARKVAVIASHRRVSQSELVSPVLRQFLEAQYALVSAEIQREVKEGKSRGSS